MQRLLKSDPDCQLAIEGRDEDIVSLEKTRAHLFDRPPKYFLSQNSSYSIPSVLFHIGKPVFPVS